LNEFENIDSFLHVIQQQSYPNFSLYVCVNQPDNWWDREDKKQICLNNQKSLQRLIEYHEFPVSVVDKSSKGNGWSGKNYGVGWARKTAMDLASANAEANDIILSVDADTYYPPNYLLSLAEIFSDSRVIGHTNPYYHKLTGRIAEDISILRYELYMRVYHINMLLIDNPFAFTAMGSGMATTAHQYRKMGGIAPKLSGEDFYFIQYLKKLGFVSRYNPVKIYPQARFSDRVNFGTGPAMIKGNRGDWRSYPFYSTELFEQIKNSFNAFEELFSKEIDFPMKSFIEKQSKNEQIWNLLKKNHPAKERFVRACHELTDGLRILQFLKDAQPKFSKGDEHDLWENLNHFSRNNSDFASFFSTLTFDNQLLTISSMTTIREELVKLEDNLLKNNPIL